MVMGAPDMPFEFDSTRDGYRSPGPYEWVPTSQNCFQSLLCHLQRETHSHTMVRRELSGVAWNGVGREYLSQSSRGGGSRFPRSRESPLTPMLMAPCQHDALTPKMKILPAYVE